MEEEFYLLQRNFMSSEMVLAKLIERFDPPAALKVPQPVRHAAQTEVIRLLERWVRDHWADVQPLAALLDSFVMQVLPREGWQAQSVQTAAIMQEKRKLATQLPPQPKALPSPLQRRGTDPPRVLSWADIDELEVARQLTLDLHSTYRHIRVRDHTIYFAAKSLIVLCSAQSFCSRRGTSSACNTWRQTCSSSFSASTSSPPASSPPGCWRA